MVDCQLCDFSHFLCSLNTVLMAKFASVTTLTLLVVFATLQGISGKHYRTARQSQNYEARYQCYQQVNFLETCPMEEYPVLTELYLAQMTGNTEKFEEMAEELSAETLCGELVPLLNCGMGMLRSISDDCQEVMFAGNPYMTYDEMIDMSSQFVNIIEDTCSNDLEFLKENEECYSSSELGEDLKSKCVKPTYNPCQEFDEVAQCMEDEIAASPLCSREAAQYFMGKIRQVFNVFQPLCNKLGGGVVRELAEKYMKKYFK